MSVLASTSTVILGTLAFLVFWVMAMFPSVPLLPVGRTCGALLSACLVVVFRVLTPSEAFAAVDLPILALLFGTMLVSLYLQRARLFEYLALLLQWRSFGPLDLLLRVSLLSSLSSMLLTNDTTCLLLTPFLLHLCRQRSLPPQPFLIALASSANVGSAATPIGNPQNLVIAVQGAIPFGTFLLGMLPAVGVGSLLNCAALVVFYRKKLRRSHETARSGRLCGGVSTAGEAPLHNLHVDAGQLEQEQEKVQCEQQQLQEQQPQQEGWEIQDQQLQLQQQQQQQSFPQGLPELDVAVLDVRRLGRHPQPWFKRASFFRTLSRLRRLSPLYPYAVTAGMLACFLAGLDLSWTALTAAAVIMCLDFRDAGAMLERVPYTLLVFFSSMFVSVAGLNATGLPNALWDALQPHCQLDTASGIALLSLLVVLLSNLASNVPTVLLLGPLVSASAAATPGVSVTTSWLLLAWTSTVAGNLTMVGSAANLIVSEQARRADFLPPVPNTTNVTGSHALASASLEPEGKWGDCTGRKESIAGTGRPSTENGVAIERASGEPLKDRDVGGAAAGAEAAVGAVAAAGEVSADAAGGAAAEIAETGVSGAEDALRAADAGIPIAVQATQSEQQRHQQQEQQSMVPEPYTLSVWNHLRFGIPTTAVVIAVGVPLIWNV